MAFLLDTNAWIVYLKSAESPIRTRLKSLHRRTSSSARSSKPSCSTARRNTAIANAA